MRRFPDASKTCWRIKKPRSMMCRREVHAREGINKEKDSRTVHTSGSVRESMIRQQVFDAGGPDPSP